MQYLRNLVYKPTANNADYVAVAALTSADKNWTIGPVVGSVDNGQQVVPNWVTVDNIANTHDATITFGPYDWLVPAYSRKSFRLPVPTQAVIVSFLDASLNVYFVESPAFSPDDQNLLAIYTAARGVALFPWVTYTALNTPQAKSDANSVAQFIGVGISIIYTLLNIAVDGVSNGWVQFLYNGGNAPVDVTPFAGDTINGVFNAANPFLLFPKEMALLQSDGTQWFLKVLGQQAPSRTYTAFSTTQNVADISKRLVFANALGQTYALLPAISFGNGDRLTIKNKGPGMLAIAPNGVETINGLYTNAAPLYLSPGDVIDLFIDDTNAWAADGEITFESPQVAITAGAVGNIAHNMRKQPYMLQAWVICLVAELGYTIGDEFLLGNSQSSSATAAANHVFRADATNIKYTLTGRAAFRLSDTGAGNDTNITLTSFKIFFRARVRL